MRVSDWIYAELSLCELYSMQLDGEVYKPASNFVACDVPNTPALKLSQLIPYDSLRYAACGLTALWVHGLANRPNRNSIALRGKHRADHFYLHNFTVREIAYLRHDENRIGEHFVLSPVRAMLEVCSDPSLQEHAAVMATATALSELPHLRRELHDRAKISRSAFSALLRERLSLADAIDVIDGFDSPHGIEHAL